MFARKPSLLLVNPDHAYSFFLKDALRRAGWRVDVYIRKDFPMNLCFRTDVISEPSHRVRILAFLFHVLLFLKVLLVYKYFVIHCVVAPSFLPVRSKTYTRTKYPWTVKAGLWIAKACGAKLVFLPGEYCHGILRSDFEILANRDACSACIRSLGCTDFDLFRDLDIINKYYSGFLTQVPMISSYITQTFLKHRFLDLCVYHPELPIPAGLRLPPTENVRIAFPFFRQTATGDSEALSSGDVDSVFDAIARLKNEGHNVEYVYLNDIPLRDFRYYVSQVDIVVDRLSYGWWSWVGVDAMALGKPVLAYLRPDWKDMFLRRFPEYSGLPIIEATRQTLYDSLKTLVADANCRRSKGMDARCFAESHFDATRNAASFREYLLSLSLSSAPVSELPRLHSPVSDERLIFATRQAVHRLIQDGITTVALYGAGKHTERLLSNVSLVPLSISCIIDDIVSETDFSGLKVISPKQFPASSCDCVIISSDVWQNVLEQKAKAWVPKYVRVVTLYK